MKRRELERRIRLIAKAKGVPAVFTEGGSHQKVTVGERSATIPRAQRDQRAHGSRDSSTLGRRCAVKVTAVATRVGRWWAVEVPEVVGVYTQVRRLDQVSQQAADAVAVMTGADRSSIDVVVRPVLDEAEQTRIDAVRSDAKVAADAIATAAVRTRELVAELRADGFSVRDVGVLIGVSPQRVSQLTGRSTSARR